MRILPQRRGMLFFALFFVGAFLFYLYYFRFRQPVGTLSISPSTTSTQNVQEAKSNLCLGDNESVSYETIKRLSGTATVNVFVKNKLTNETLRHFAIEGFDPGSVGNIELHNCNIYVIRSFNFNPSKFKFLPGYSQELWQYDYDNNGERLLTLASVDANGKENVPFGLYFRVDPTETYLNLTRGYFGSSDYAIVVKDLKKLNDVFVLTLDDLVNKYGAHRGEIGTRTWIDENRFIGFVTEGPTVYDAIFVDKNGWKVSVFPTPEDAVAVNAWSPDYSWIAYNNGPGWIGVEEVAQQIYAEWRKEGKKKSLFAYNFFTKQKIILATVDDPGWDFKPKWISDMELQYTLPSGVTTTYKIPQ